VTRSGILPCGPPGNQAKLSPGGSGKPGQGIKKRAGEMIQAVAYLRISSATNIGTDKDGDKRQRDASAGFASLRSKLFDYLISAGGWTARAHRNFGDAPFANERLNQRAIRMRSLSRLQPRRPVPHLHGCSRVGVPSVLLFRFVSHRETRFAGGDLTHDASAHL
jgi:hypothetical protein